MAHVIFLRGVNVGGHRVFRPTVLVRELEHLDVVNIGAAGTFVVRAPITQAKLRAEVARRLPFQADIMICPGRSIARLVARDFFAGERARTDLVRFVSVMSRRAREVPSLPLHIPSRDGWLVRVLAIEDRFVVGVYRRQMKAVGHLGQLDRIFGTPVTTRNWNTLAAVARVLKDPD